MPQERCPPSRRNPVRRGPEHAPSSAAKNKSHAIAAQRLFLEDGSKTGTAFLDVHLRPASALDVMATKRLPETPDELKGWAATFFETIKGESDRRCVLVAPAFLDEALELLLRSRMGRNPSELLEYQRLADEQIQLGDTDAEKTKKQRAQRIVEFVADMRRGRNKWLRCSTSSRR